MDRTSCFTAPGGHTGRPYARPPAWSVGRGAHTPPMQAAGTAGLADIATLLWRHVGMPPYEVRQEYGANRGLFGRLIAAPTPCHRPGL